MKVPMDKSFLTVKLFLALLSVFFMESARADALSSNDAIAALERIYNARPELIERFKFEDPQRYIGELNSVLTLSPLSTLTASYAMSPSMIAMGSNSMVQTGAHQTTTVVRLVGSAVDGQSWVLTETRVREEGP